MKLINGDSLVELKKLPDNSVDSVVTDPPYGLSFMGKKWDYDVPSVELWKEVYRVLKPGGHLLSFAGTRTQHRMAVNIEDAGFEIRDMIAWVYGCLSEDSEVLTESGFKHFHKITQYDKIRTYDIKNNIYKWERPQRWSQYFVKQDTAYRIKSNKTDQIVSRNHNCLVERNGKLVFKKAEELLQVEQVPYLPNNIPFLQEKQGKLLLKNLLWKSKELAKTIFSKWERKEKLQKRYERRQKPSVERWGYLQKPQRKIQQSINKVCEMSQRFFINGSQRRLRYATQTIGSTTNWAASHKTRSGSSYQSRCDRQPDKQSDVIQNEQRPQKIRVGRTCKTTMATIEPITYSGMIFCPTVSTGAFVARRNGKVFITGNSGFPKSHNIGKAVDKIQGNEREFVGKGRHSNIHSFADNTKYTGTDFKPDITKGNSEWEGWGTALKPALEPITVARKPISEKTIAENVLKWGTGGINIDECRVKHLSESDRLSATPQGKPTSNLNSGGAPDVNMKLVDYHGEKYWYKSEYKWLIDKWLNDEDYVWSELKENLEKYDWCNVPDINDGDRVLFDSLEGVCIRLYESKRKDFQRPDTSLGRFPANIIHDGSEEVVSLFPDSKAGKYKGEGSKSGGIFNKSTGEPAGMEYGDSGSAARFFYCAKASKSERNEGCDGLKTSEKFTAGNYSQSPTCKDCNLTLNGTNDHSQCSGEVYYKEMESKNTKNHHPTVKPVALMEYLVRLITPKGGVVLDPFMGSGSTGVACKKLGFDFIGIDLEKEYCDIAEARINNIK